MFKKDEVVLVMALPSESQKLFEQAGVEVFYSGIGESIRGLFDRA